MNTYKCKSYTLMENTLPVFPNILVSRFFLKFKLKKRSRTKVNGKKK